MELGQLKIAIIKKTQKMPNAEIQRAEKLLAQYQRAVSENRLTIKEVHDGRQ